jgi:hypothetical protein
MRQPIRRSIAPNPRPDLAMRINGEAPGVLAEEAAHWVHC